MSVNFKRKKFRLISVAYFLSLSALSVSLLAYFSQMGTFSWFGLNKQVSATGLAIKAKGYDGLVKKITAHEFFSKDGDIYTFSSEAAVTYTIDSSTGSITSSNSKQFSFGVYDTLSPKDAYAVMFLFELDSSVAKSKGSVNILASTSTALEQSLAKTVLKESGNPMSSIVEFFSAQSSNVSYKIDTSSINKGRFLNLDSISKPVYEASLNQGSYSSFEGGTSYLQVVCEYSVENIEKIYSLNISNEIFNTMSEDKNITYSQDWTVTLS